jgi:DNA-binding XRE family transcriptional regulator
MSKKFVKEPNWYGLDYVTVLLPVSRVSEQHGELVDAKVWSSAELLVGRELIVRGYPIRGIELKYLRKVLGHSLREFASLLGLSQTAVMKWEKQSKRRLEPINEVAVRALCAQLLKVEIRAWFDELRGREKPEHFQVKVPDAA